MALLEYDCYEDHHKILFMRPAEDCISSWWPIDKPFLSWEEVKYRYESWRAVKIGDFAMALECAKAAAPFVNSLITTIDGDLHVTGDIIVHQNKKK